MIELKNKFIEIYNSIDSALGNHARNNRKVSKYIADKLNMKLIGYGYSRCVLEYSKDKVIKVIQNYEGLVANELESKLWECVPKTLKKYLAPICEYDKEDFIYIVMKKENQFTCNEDFENNKEEIEKIKLEFRKHNIYLTDAEGYFNFVYDNNDNILLCDYADYEKIDKV